MINNVLELFNGMIRKYEANAGKKPEDILLSKEVWEEIKKMELEERRKHINFKSIKGTAVVCIDDVPIKINNNYVLWKDYKYE